jgi:16S rRNA (cytidine1402-2'-O)-methyltransferase
VSDPVNLLPSTPAVGRLWLVGTPIGNLGDLSSRAGDVLRSADVIACEDSRRTGRLLAHLGIAHRTLLVVNEHTEFGRRSEILGHLAAGRTVAMVSDAGMPLVSDPGARIVHEALEAGFEIEVAPGPTALITALVLSGLAADRFVFEGFLPRKGEARSRRLASFVGEERTVVFYESPRRAARSLQDLIAVCGGSRRVAVARELTKLHEEVLRGTLTEVVERLGAEVRGEVVVVLEGAPKPGEPADADLESRLRSELAGGSTLRDAVAVVVSATGAPKRRVYGLAIALASG